MSIENAEHSHSKSIPSESSNVLRESFTLSEASALFKKMATREDNESQFFCSTDEKPKKDPAISDTTVKDYIKSFENMVKNEAASKESLAAFKKAAKEMSELDNKALKKTLEDASKDPKVDMELVVRHLKEICESSGFTDKVAPYKGKPKEEAGFILKHPKKETYVQIDWTKKGGVTVYMEDTR